MTVSELLQHHGLGHIAFIHHFGGDFVVDAGEHFRPMFDQMDMMLLGN